MNPIIFALRHPLTHGLAVRAFEGESVAAALLAGGRRALRTAARRAEPRGMYCGIGVCFDCVMTVDGRPNVRTCRTPVRAGMRIESQRGEGTWSTRLDRCVRRTHLFSRGGF